MVEFKGKFDEKVQNSVEKRSFKTASIIIAVFSAVLLLLGVIGLVWGEDHEDLVYSIYCLMLGVLFYPLYLIIYAIMRKFIKPNTALISNETEQQFQFFEDRFICSQIKGDEFNDFMQAKYSVLFKVIETKEQYFLYISRAQCFVVNKADLTAGSIEELNNTLSLNLGERFKRLKIKQQEKF